MSEVIKQQWSQIEIEKRDSHDNMYIHYNNAPINEHILQVSNINMTSPWVKSSRLVIWS